MFSKRFFVISVLIAVLLIFPFSKVAEASAGLDLNRYCRDAGYLYATLDQFNAFGWVCVANDGSHHGMDLSQACHQQYGNDWWARYSDFRVNRKIVLVF